MAVFRKSKLADASNQWRRSPISVAVKTVEVVHEVTYEDVERWLTSIGKSSKEQALKTDLQKLIEESRKAQ